MGDKPNGSKRFIIPLIIIMIGAMWLLNVMEVMPEIDWFWTGGLAGFAVLIFILGGLDKVTMVVGPWFVLASLASVLRQTDRLTLQLEVPILTIAFGILLLLVEAAKLPLPSYLLEPPSDNDEDEEPSDSESD